MRDGRSSGRRKAPTTGKRRRKAARKLQPLRAPPTHVAREGSVGDFIAFLLAGAPNTRICPPWPPDLFAVTGSILRRSGGYLRTIDFAADATTRGSRRTMWKKAAEAGRAWRVSIRNGLRTNGKLSALPDWMQPDVTAWWQIVVANMHQPLSATNQSNPLTEALIALTIAADEACLGVGIDHAARKTVARNESRDDPFLGAAQALLFRNQRRSVCLDVAIDRIAVLGKQHTAQRGLTMRSLTHNLALYPTTEIVARWAGPYSQRDTPDIINLLLLPWPAHVSANDFRCRHDAMGGDTSGSTPSQYRYFEYQPAPRESLAEFERRLRFAVSKGQREADRIDAIVLPELALTWEEYLVAEAVAIENRALLISGVRVDQRHVDSGGPVNACCVQPLGLTPIGTNGRKPTWSDSLRNGLRLVQRKHHRWCLDRNQILQYELGGRLPASKDCWEYIDIGERTVNFMTLGTWLTWSVLICEDLARQDPVVDVLRAVGPNLVIALLMDGPQLRNRWPSRYASVLAEDPGSSVLTLTSLGMCRRSKPKPGDDDKSRTIALWRDVQFGEQEIELKEGTDACVLSLVCRSVSEYTSDGRRDDEQAHYPVFAGTHCFDSTEPADPKKAAANAKKAATHGKKSAAAAISQASEQRVPRKVFGNRLGDELGALLALAAVRRHPFLDENFLLPHIRTSTNRKIAHALAEPKRERSLTQSERSYLHAIKELAGLADIADDDTLADDDDPNAP